MKRLAFLDADEPTRFPPVANAWREPDGLLAAGGDLSTERLLAAYRRGIFPWYSDGEPILWWSPALRTVFDTDAMHVPRRLARWLRSCDWIISADTAFEDVMRACAAPREKQRGTWISEDIVDAYSALHALGHAHSVEIREDGRLVGGIYGMAIGRMFFGESMFSTAPNASKLALLALARALRDRGCPLLDAQVASPHLFTLGARLFPREAFCETVAELCSAPPAMADWRIGFPALHPADLAA